MNVAKHTKLTSPPKTSKIAATIVLYPNGFGRSSTSSCVELMFVFVDISMDRKKASEGRPTCSCGSPLIEDEFLNLLIRPSKLDIFGHYWLENTSERIENSETKTSIFNHSQKRKEPVYRYIGKILKNRTNFSRDEKGICRYNLRSGSCDNSHKRSLWHKY